MDAAGGSAMASAECVLRCEETGDELGASSRRGAEVIGLAGASVYTSDWTTSGQMLHPRPLLARLRTTPRLQPRCSCYKAQHAKRRTHGTARITPSCQHPWSPESF